MKWDRLRLFNVVAQAKSLTDSAALLNISQSALSRQMQSLEHEVGNRLFVRRSRGIELTPAGIQVAEAAKKLVKRTGKTILKRIGPIATVLTAAEIAKGAYKGAKKVGASLKAKKACEGKGNVYRKGFCISSKTIKSKSLRTVKK